MGRAPVAAGKSSFDLIDRETFFSALNLAPSAAVLDLGCGVGNYVMAMAARIGPGGRIIGLDAWPEGVETLRRRAVEAQTGPVVEAMVADVANRIPLPTASVDLCLMATVYHDLVQEELDEAVLAAVFRVLKPDGRLAVVEFKRMDGPPGPPRRIRIGPNELRGRLAPFGFEAIQTVSLGAFVYMSVFGKCRDGRRLPADKQSRG